MSRRSSKSSSGKNSPGRERILELLLRLASECRRLGLKVGSSQIEDAVRLYETYMELGGREKEDLTTLKKIAATVFVKKTSDERLFEAAWNKTSPQKSRLLGQLIGMVERDLEILGLRYGYRVPPKKSLIEASGKRRRAEKRRAYSELRGLGIIARTRQGERVLPRDEAISLLRRLAENSRSLRDAAGERLARGLLRGMPIPEPEALSNAHIPEDMVKELSPDTLARLGYRSLKAHNKRLAYSAARRLAELLEQGQRVSEAWKAYSLLKTTNLLSPKAALSLVLYSQKLAPHILRNLNAKDLVKAIQSMESNEARRVLGRLSKAMRRDKLLEIIEKLPPNLLGELYSSSLTRDERWLVEALRRYSESRRMLLEYLSTGRKEYLEMAWHEYSKASAAQERIRQEGITEPFRKIVDELDRMMLSLHSILQASEEGRGPGLARMTRDMDLGEALQLLSRAYNSGDPELRREAMKLAQRLFRVRLAREKSRVLRRWEKNRVSGRLELRNTLLSLTRMESNPLVYRRRRKGGRIVLILDASGSMLEYSMWALLTASSFAGMVKRIVIFRDYTETIEASRLRASEIINLLFETGFSGYTDIGGALVEASRGIPPSTLVLVSDLHQTTGAKPPHEVAERLIRSGWRIIALAPRRHDAMEADMLRDRGAHIEVVDNPSAIARKILRLLYW